MAEVREVHRRAAHRLRIIGRLLKRILTLGWLLVQGLAMAGWGWVTIGLTVFWSIGFWRLLNHDLLHQEGYEFMLEFMLLSVFFGFMVFVYVVAVRTWWPHAVRIVRGDSQVGLALNLPNE